MNVPWSEVSWYCCTDPELTPDRIRNAGINILEEKKKDGSAFSWKIRKTVLPGRIDFAEPGAPLPVESPAAAFMELDSAEECDTLVGACGDWWFALYLNGETLFDCLETSNGNVFSPFGRPLKCHLKKGNNVFSVFLKTGLRAIFDFGFLPPATRYPEEWQEEMMNCFFPSRHELNSLPWLTGASCSGMTVSFSAKSLCGAELLLRKTGESEEKEVGDVRFGQVRINHFHRFELTDLLPDTAYEYRIRIRWEDTPEDPVVCGPWTFRTLPREPERHAILFCSDTHDFLPETEAIFRKWHENGIDRECLLYGHLGDVLSRYTGIDSGFVGGFLKMVQKIRGNDVSWLFTRGNHEFRGKESLRFPEYAAGKTYEAFVIGNVFYLKLDTGWDVNHSAGQEWRDAVLPYMRKQKEWLEKVVVSPAWKEARFHVVLTHALPCYDFSHHVTRNIRLLAEELFLGETPRERVDLWLAGHTHWAARFDVEKQTFCVAEPLHHTRHLDADFQMLSNGVVSQSYIVLPFTRIPFPVVALDGPNPKPHGISAFRLEAGPEGLHGLHYSREGEIIDEFVIGNDHLLNVKQSRLFSLAAK